MDFGGVLKQLFLKILKIQLFKQLASFHGHHVVGTVGCKNKGNPNGFQYKNDLPPVAVLAKKILEEKANQS
jgi:hypothetical protein